MRRVPRGVHLHRIPMGPINRLLARAMNNRAGPAAGAVTGRGVGGVLSRCANWALQARRLWQPLAIPDASIDWLPYAALKARRLLREFHFDLVISLGNPQTCHLAAFLATRRSRCRWVPFYGDAWGLDPGLTARPAWTRSVNRMLERRVLKGAAGVAVCTEEMKAGLAAAYGIPPARITSTRLAMPDLDAYEAVERKPAAGFELVYTGTIYQALQDPLPFLRAASRIAGGALAISFIGMIPDEYTRAAAALGLNAAFPGWRPPGQIIAAQKNATALLLFGHRGGHVIPSKIYEYLAARRPILCISGDERDLAAPLVHRHRRGVVVANREGEIEQALRALIDLHARARLDESFDLGLLPQYAAAATVGSLMDGIFKAALNEPCQPPCGIGVQGRVQT